MPTSSRWETMNVHDFRTLSLKFELLPPIEDSRMSHWQIFNLYSPDTLSYRDTGMIIQATNIC